MMMHAIGASRRLLAAALLLVLASASPADAAEGEALFARVSAKYAALKSLSAKFRQEVPLPNIGVVRKASGEVFFARPSRMRWDYRKPDDQLFLADGESLWFRPTGSKQVFRRKIGEGALGGKIPLLLFFGKGDASKLFSVEAADPARKGAATMLRLVPKGDGAPEVRSVDLLVEHEGLVILEIHLHDRLGGTNHLYLESVRFDPSLPADLFRFRKPAGAEVVDG